MSRRELLVGEARVAALARIPQWKNVAGRDAIERTYLFKDFKTCFFDYMQAVGVEAERLNHHPEWFNVYNKLHTVLATHDANGVTLMDIELALFMDALYDKMTKTEKQ